MTRSTVLTALTAPPPSLASDDVRELGMYRALTVCRCLATPPMHFLWCRQRAPDLSISRKREWMSEVCRIVSVKSAEVPLYCPKKEATQSGKSILSPRHDGVIGDESEQFEKPCNTAVESPRHPLRLLSLTRLSSSSPGSIGQKPMTLRRVCPEV